MEIEGPLRTPQLRSPSSSRHSNASARQIMLPEVMTNWEIAAKFIGIVIPTLTQNVLGFILLIINLYFCGLLENAAITAGFGLATTFIHVFGMSLMIGTNITQETLTSQAFGAGELVRCGILLNRGRLIILAMSVPISIIFLLSK